ncbi:hypothetical protein BCR39DRAFT_470533 [Naematelia encephala]|uniref:Rhomboid-type serine protease n=1 Tax=Naematelia encephala TaxID=71784 RepID=A0A1Y2AVK0_9TREE|nr:hypothetical protein BCR39DRAFT_470533 [Naematelia encephala]
MAFPSPLATNNLFGAGDKQREVTADVDTPSTIRAVPATSAQLVEAPLPSPFPLPTARPISFPNRDVVTGYLDPHEPALRESLYSNPDEAERASSPTIGPWDSSSQRSYPTTSSRLTPHHTVALSDGATQTRSKTSMGGLSYIDEEGAYYRSPHHRPASHMDPIEMQGLVLNAAPPGTDTSSIGGVKYAEDDLGPYLYQPESVDDTRGTGSKVYDLLLFPTGLDRLLALFGMHPGRYPVEQAIERKRRGLGGQRWPVAAWTLTVVMTAVLVFELVRNFNATGSVIALHPTVNYMVGPSSEVLINIGARFPPCMHLVEAIPPTFEFECLNDTSSTPTTSCTLEEICGHGGFHGQDPNQSWRFVAPIFLHVGVIHLLLNMLAQVTAGAQIEREMGTIPFLIVYFAGGIYGFVLGGNFALPGIPSVGASGALFAINACVLVDLILHWRYEERPKLKAFFLFVEFCIGIGMGYIPFAVDGFAHLGGWAMGLLCGIILYPSISETKTHRFAIWFARLVALVLIIIAFVLTIKNFYTSDPNASCEWCKFLSCIPTSSNNHCQGTVSQRVIPCFPFAWVRSHQVVGSHYH